MTRFDLYLSLFWHSSLDIVLSVTFCRMQEQSCWRDDPSQWAQPLHCRSSVLGLAGWWLQHLTWREKTQWALNYKNIKLSFSITPLIFVVIFGVDMMVSYINRSSRISLAVGSCQDILFVDDGTATTPEVPYALCSMGKFEGAWFNS